MSEPEQGSCPGLAAPRPWDARLARQLVRPLKDSWVRPNHLTTVRLAVGLAAAAAFIPGTYRWSNLAALLLILSNLLDHTDGELARMSGRSSRFGHWYDVASDAAVGILLFVCIGIGVAAGAKTASRFPLLLQGAVAGTAVAVIFFLRMYIEEIGGKDATKQAALGGFESEDVLYLMPLVTLCNALPAFLTAASIIAPLFAVWVVIDYRRTVRWLRGAARRAPEAGR